MRFVVLALMAIWDVWLGFPILPLRSEDKEEKQ